MAAAPNGDSLPNIQREPPIIPAAIVEKSGFFANARTTPYPPKVSIHHSAVPSITKLIFWLTPKMDRIINTIFVRINGGSRKMPIITSAANTKNNNMIGTVCSICILVPPSQQAKPNVLMSGGPRPSKRKNQ